MASPLARSRAESNARADADAERFVRSVKEECLNRLAILGETHLRRTLRLHRTLNWERNHQGLQDRLIMPTLVDPPDGPYTLSPATRRAASILLSGRLMTPVECPDSTGWLCDAIIDQ